MSFRKKFHWKKVISIALAITAVEGGFFIFWYYAYVLGPAKQSAVNLARAEGFAAEFQARYCSGYHKQYPSKGAKLICTGEYHEF